jgi:hypothetical protein
MTPGPELELPDTSSVLERASAIFTANMYLLMQALPLSVGLKHSFAKKKLKQNSP